MRPQNKWVHILKYVKKSYKKALTKLISIDMIIPIDIGLIKGENKR